jgi:hypothetical protein
VLFDLRTPFQRRLGHHVLTTENQQVEYEEVQRLALDAILERAEGRPPGFIERHHFEVEDRLVRELKRAPPRGPDTERSSPCQCVNAVGPCHRS